LKDLEQYCVHEASTMMEAIAVIQENHSRCVIVLNRANKVVGVFSEGDVLRAILAGTEVHTQLCHLVKPSFYFLKTRDLEVARDFIISGVTLIPVINDEYQLVSVLTIQDIFGAKHE